MKKTTLLTFIISLIIAGCSNANNVVPGTDTNPKESRTTNISTGISSDDLEFHYSYDFDADGNEEMIKIKCPEYTGEILDEQYIDVTIGDYHQKFDIFEGMLEEVYLCDMDINDGKKDLAIITCESSGDPRIRILSYAPNLPAYHFYSEWSDDAEDCLWLGYTVNYYFNVNDDDTLTLEMQTSSEGMWTVYKTFVRDKSGVFAEEKPEYYEILPDFMEESYIYTDTFKQVKETEKEMWGKGYIKAYKTLKNKNFVINDGEYFKIPYDSGDNEIYIEKENGEAACVKLENDKFYGLNEYFFYLAG